jgi:putative ubiquitin-RnfH superfamily antitoxin RatB of RatAB toxin-antitoxin module
VPADTTAGMRIEVVYSPAARRVDIACVELPDGATLESALRSTGWWPDGVLPPGLKFGVWGQARAPEQVLREGDRVEVYRGLQIDPKEARRGGRVGPLEDVVLGHATRRRQVAELHLASLVAPLPLGLHAPGRDQQQEGRDQAGNRADRQADHGAKFMRPCSCGAPPSTPGCGGSHTPGRIAGPSV